MDFNIPVIYRFDFKFGLGKTETSWYKKVDIVLIIRRKISVPVSPFYLLSVLL